MIKKLFFIYVLLSGSCMLAMTFDNRYLPLLFKPFTRKIDSLSNFRIQPFFMRAERAHGSYDETSIPHITGTYDQIEIARALTHIGKPNLLPSNLRTLSNLTWRRQGHIDAQGIAFYFEQELGCFTSIGTSFLFAHINSAQEFCLDNSIGNRQRVFSLREKIDQELGVTPPLYQKLEFGDLDLYLRWGTIAEYVCRLKRIDSGLKIGVIVPTAPLTPLNNPAAIPLGGEKHWGVYIGLDNEIELKEDWIVGFQFRAIKRLPKTYERRFPLNEEPTPYGVFVAPLFVNPGWTFVFNPYLSLEGLREGFGLKAQYTLIAHLKDNIEPQCRDFFQQRKRFETNKKNNGNVKVDRSHHTLISRSSWGSEYVTIGAFYDFGKSCETNKWKPIISAYWDIPVDWQVSKRSAITHCVSLMLELNF